LQPSLDLDRLSYLGSQIANQGSFHEIFSNRK